jgi:hypothetical protein
MKYFVHKSSSKDIGTTKLQEVDSLQAGIDWLAEAYKDRDLVLGEIDNEVTPPAYDAFYGPLNGDDGVIVSVQAETFKYKELSQ